MTFLRHGDGSMLEAVRLDAVPDRAVQTRDAALAVLLGRVAGRDPHALRALYDLTSPKLYGAILRIQRDRSLAEDVLQDVYLRVWQAAGSYASGSGRPMTWLCAIARNRAIDSLRRPREIQQPVDDDERDEPEDWIARSADPACDGLDLDDRRALLACLGRLHPMHRDCIVLAYCEGWSREELARRYDRPVNTIKTWLHRSLMLLRAGLDDR